MNDPHGRTRFARFWPTLVCLLLLVADGAIAQEAKKGVMNPEAISAFKRMSKSLKDAKTMSFTSSGLYEVADASGIKELHTRTGLIVMQRPNRFFARTRRDNGWTTRTWFDGETLSVPIAGGEGVRYASIAAPEGAKTIDGMLDHLEAEYGFVMQLGDLLYSDVYGMLEDALLSAEHLGRALVGGRPCHHLSFEFEGADAQLWVEDGDDPAPCRWAFTLKGEPSEPLYVTNFDSWVTGLSVDVVSFASAAPAGATKTEMKDLLKLLSAN